MTGTSPSWNIKPMLVDDPMQRKPDITLAREIMGLGADIQLKEGLAKTIGYFREMILAY